MDDRDTPYELNEKGLAERIHESLVKGLELEERLQVYGDIADYFSQISEAYSSREDRVSGTTSAGNRVTLDNFAEFNRLTLELQDERIRTLTLYELLRTSYPDSPVLDRMTSVAESMTKDSIDHKQFLIKYVSRCLSDFLGSVEDIDGGMKSGEGNP